MIERGVVFDFDGVLADTELLHLAAYQDVFAPRGWTLDESTYFTRYLGYDDRDLLRLYAADNGVAMPEREAVALLEQKTVAYEHAINTRNVLYPSAAATVRAIAGRFHVAIASGSRRREIVQVLGGSGLGDLFPVIISADDCAKSKPAPDPYLVAVTGLGLSPSSCVAIEDSHWGLTAARIAGLRTIGVTTTSSADLLASADRIVRSIADVNVALIESVLSS